uniref:RING-type domain-containing protein n=1 Tax=Sphenodon punctatus TaxID=8508 RepID=A0A8D0GJE2_SPHPU
DYLEPLFRQAAFFTSVSGNSLQGHFAFHCPDDVDGKKCGKEWSYWEVRQNASLNKTEQDNFEEKIALFAAKRFCDFKECANCESHVECKDLTNLRVYCIICHSLKGMHFEFCWQCLKPWKGSGTASDKCENEGCVNQQLEVLANCKLKDLPGSEIKTVLPSGRVPPVGCSLSTKRNVDNLHLMSS